MEHFGLVCKKLSRLHFLTGENSSTLLSKLGQKLINANLTKSQFLSDVSHQFLSINFDKVNKICSGWKKECACSFVSVNKIWWVTTPPKSVYCAAEKWQKKICSGDAKAKAASIISSPQNLFQPPGLIHRGQNSSVLCLKFRRRKEKSMRRSIMRNKFC